MGKNQKLFLTLMGLGHVFILAAGLMFRIVDADEGGMLLVAREVVQGRIPVLEINAHNQPLLYYFYGLWMNLFGFGILPARALSALCIFLNGLLLIWWVYGFTKNYWTTVCIYFLFISNITFFKENIPAIQFALSNLLTFASFAALSRGYLLNNSLTHYTLLFSGFLLGVSMGVRLIFALPVVFVLWIVFILSRNGALLKEIAKKAAVFSAGVAVPLMPSLLIFIKAPLKAYSIWFGAYAQVYLGKGDNPDFATDVLSDLKRVMMVNGLMETVKKPDMAFLISLCLVSTVVYFRYRKRLAGILLVYSSLFAGYQRYVNQLVNFAIILAIPLIETSLMLINRRTAKIFLPALFLLLSIGLYQLYFKRLTTVRSFHSKETLLMTPRFVNSVSEDVIKKLTREDDTVFDITGAFVLASGRKPVTGLEYPTDIPIFWNFMRQKENAWKYHFIPELDLLQKIERRELRLVIIVDDSELIRSLKDKEFYLRTRWSSETLRGGIDRNYDLYTSYFVRPPDLWILIYVPKDSLAAAIGAM